VWVRRAALAVVELVDTSSGAVTVTLSPALAVTESEAPPTAEDHGSPARGIPGDGRDTFSSTDPTRRCTSSNRQRNAVSTGPRTGRTVHNPGAIALRLVCAPDVVTCSHAFRRPAPQRLPIPSGEPVAWQTVAMASETTSKARAWAKQTGVKVSDRGRLPASLLDAYQAANTTKPAPPAKRPATTTPTTAPPSKKRPSAPGRNKTAVATKVQGNASLTADQELFDDQQSVLRRLSSLEGQVAELLGKLETAARALHPHPNGQG